MTRIYRAPTGPLPRVRCQVCRREVPVSTCADGHQVHRKHPTVPGLGDVCDGSRRSVDPADLAVLR